MCVKRIGGAAKLNQHMVRVGESRIGKVHSFGAKGDLALPPARKFAILT
jgi:hypothetical protein